MRNRRLFGSVFIVILLCAATAWAGPLEEAAVALKKGDMAQAKLLYDQALQQTPTSTNAAFGAALTRMVLLADHPAAQTVLTYFNQKAAPSGNFVGPTSYLAALAKRNSAKVSTTGLNVTGPWFGAATSPNSKSGGASSSSDLPDDGPWCKSETHNFSVWNVDKQLTAYASLLTKVTLVQSDGAESVVYQVKPGVPIDLSQKFPADVCPNYVSELSSASVCWQGSCASSGPYATNPLTGSVILQSLTEQSIRVQLKGLKMKLSDGSVTPAFDIAVKDDFVPFVYAKNYIPFIPTYTWKALIAKAQAGLTVPAVIAKAQELIPALKEILPYLQKAAVSTKNGATQLQFAIPKEAFFGVKDVVVNRADAYALRAVLQLGIAGLYVLDSWKFPITLDGMFTEQGTLKVAKATLVQELNDSFGLKPDHKLVDAQKYLNAGIHTLASAISIANSATTKPGILDYDLTLKPYYDDLAKLVKIARLSLLKGPQSLTYVEPPLTVDLQHFFQEPPNGDAIAYDPFVLENGKITIVESYFEEVLKGVLDIDIGAEYHWMSESITYALVRDLFDEFHKFNVAGELLWKKPNGTSSSSSSSGGSGS